MARGHSAEQWACWMEEQPHSGLTVAEFCEAVGVSPNSFYRWRRLLAREAGPGAATGVTSEAAACFVPLTLVESPRIEIELPCGATLRVPNDGGLLRQVLEALLAAPREGAAG